jgi:hypothetical protein
MTDGIQEQSGWTADPGPELGIYARVDVDELLRHLPERFPVLSAKDTQRVCTPYS